MPTVSLRIPQIGEGLQEARLVAVLKQPGEKVRRDEPIYQMETDKAVMDVESPYEGTLQEWLAPVDTILPIGGEVARMDVAEGVQEMQVHGAPVGVGLQAGLETAEASAAGPQTGESSRNANIPPRTRAYAKEKGLSDEDLASISAPGLKLMPADVDAFLSRPSPVGRAVVQKGAGYKETQLSQKQRLISSRLQRGNQLAVPGTITAVADWGPIEGLRARNKAGGGDFQPSAFTMFAYAVAQALKEFPAFRSTLRGEDTLRTYEHAALGIAVALPGDELVTAVVQEADSLSWQQFAKRSREQIDLARNGTDQATEATTISLTNMQSFGLRDAVPVVVPPAVATLFLGEVHNGLDSESKEIRLKRVVNLVLTFDHRLINGVGAAEFLNAVKNNVERIDFILQ